MDNPPDIIFSGHAIERMRKRNISDEFVSLALSDPDRVSRGRRNVKVYFKQVGNVKFRVVARPKADGILVITVIKD